MADGDSTPAEQINNDSPAPSDQNSSQEKPVDAVETQVAEEKQVTPPKEATTEKKPIEPVEPTEPVGDPLDELFDGKGGAEKSNLSGQDHLEKAVGKKFDELQEGIQNGDPKALLEFKNLKPKLQEGVTKRLSAVITIENEALTDAKQILDYYEDVLPKETTSTASTESDAKNITLSLQNKFMEKAVAEGLKPEEMQDHKKEVVKQAKQVLAQMKSDKIPLSKFDKYFNFNSAYLTATHEIQAAAAHAKGIEQGKNIEGGKTASPSTNAALPKPGEQVTFDKLVSESDYYSLDEAQRKVYRGAHTNKGTGFIRFTDSTLE